MITRPLVAKLRARADATALRIVGAAGLFTAAAWGTWGWTAGAAVAGASLLALDYLSGEDQGAASE
jgi:hypothetical protein